MTNDNEERIGAMTSDRLREVVPKVVSREPHVTVLPEDGDS